MTSPSPERFSEPWSTTLIRTVGLAVAIGLGVGLYHRRLALVPSITFVALWFTLGGHFVELLCRNELRPRLAGRPLAFVARLTAWFVGGSVLYWGALVTTPLITGHRPLSWPWWAGGLLLIAAELAIHLTLRVRGLPSAYDGRA